MAEPAKKTDASTPKLVEQKSDFSQIHLALDMVTPSPKDRKGQVVRIYRAEPGVLLMEHPHGVEVTGPSAAWRGVVPWSSIKLARR